MSPIQKVRENSEGWEVVISHEYKCVYIHIPKTAGTSVMSKLKGSTEIKRGEQDHRSLRDLIDSQPLEWRDFRNKEKLKTKTIRRLKDYMRGYEFVPREVINSYYKFAFVRNPWDRVYSWYGNIMRDPMHQKKLRISTYCSFTEFVSNHLDQFALKSQMEWVIGYDGKIGLDFIGKFESLQRDFREVCDEIGLNDYALPELVVGKKKNYSENYDAKSIQIVAKQYAEEIKFFGYQFDA